MSETLATHHRIVERLSRHNNLRFDKFSWPSDGHECPSYCSFFLVHGTCLFLFVFQHRRLWNPVGVRGDPGFLTWGAPERGDPRLCCETLSGLKHTISLRKTFRAVATHCPSGILAVGSG